MSIILDLVCIYVYKYLTSTAVSSSAQLKELYFLLNLDLANMLGASSRDNPFPVVMADHTIKPKNNNINIHYTALYVTFRIITIKTNIKMSYTLVK